MRIKVGGNRDLHDQARRAQDLPSYEEFLEAFLKDRAGNSADLNAMMSKAQAAFTKRPRRRER